MPSKTKEPFDPRFDEPKPADNKVEIELPPGMTQEDLIKLLAKKKVTEQTGEPIIFATIERKPGTELRVSKDYYKGRLLLSIRSWYSENEGEPVNRPGKGVTFNYEDIDLLIEGLIKMKNFLEEHPQEE